MSYRMLEFIDRTSAAFRNANSMQLKEVSNEATREAVAGNDRVFARIAVVAYSLSKLASKQHFAESTSWGRTKKAILDSLERLSQLLRKNRKEEFAAALNSFENEVRKVDASLGNYVRNIIEKAKVKVSSGAYAQGLSLSSAAELTGAGKTDLQNYIGITKIHDEEETKLFMTERMKKIRRIFSRSDSRNVVA